VTHPSVDQFKKDLAYLYYLRNSPPLNKGFFDQLVDVFADLYKCLNNTPAETYSIYLETCSLSLTNFTRLIHFAVLEQPPIKSLFTATKLVTEFLYAGEGFLYKPAFQALAEPFKDASKKFGTAFKGIIHGPADFLFFPESKNPSDDLDHKEYMREYNRRERRWEREYEAWKRDLAKATDELSSFELCFCLTPLFQYRHSFLPSFQIQLPFTLSERVRFRGHWIVAPPDKGKTNLLLNMIIEDMKSDASVIVMDSKGDLIDPLKRIRDPRLIIIDPLDHPAINPLDTTNSVDLLEYIFSGLLESPLTPNQTALFRSVLGLLRLVPNATLRDFRNILSDGWEPYEKYVDQLDEDDQTFFRKEFKSNVYKERRPEVLVRLRLLLSNPHFRAMFTAPKTKVHLGQLMNQGKLIIIDNSKAKLGDSGTFFARLFVALILGEAERRSGTEKPVYVYIDECQNVIRNDPKIATILDECRSKRIALVLSHQRVAQIEDNKNVLDALMNCGIRFASSNADAPALAPRFHAEPEFLQNLEQGTFAAYIDGTTKTPEHISCPLAQLPPQMSESEYQSFKLTMRARFGIGHSPPAAPDFEAPPRDEAPPPQPPPKAPPRPQAAECYDLEWEITVSPRVAKNGGKVRVQHLMVHITPGTKDGDRLRVKERGAAKPDGTRGHLFLTVNVPDAPKPAAGVDEPAEWG
jgi:hypothetical protein